MRGLKLLFASVTEMNNEERTRVRLPVPAGTGRTLVQLPERSLQGFNFSLIVNLLSFRQLARFEHFFHFAQHLLQLLNDSRDLINRPADARFG